jgi:hypothetical protein
MKAYADLKTLKSEPYLGIKEEKGYDAALRGFLEDASEEIDIYCRRHFECWEGAKYADGQDKELFLPDDLLSIATIKLDLDGDDTYETTMAATDYYQYPYNGYPIEILKAAPSSSYGGFASGVLKGVEITGVWGYGDGKSATPYKTSGGTGTVADGTSTTLTLSAADLVIPGQTIRCESEQMYVEDVMGTSATVERGVNGTTGASHTGKAVYIYRYPSQITQACLIQAVKAYKRASAAYEDYDSSPEMGQARVAKGLDTDAKRKIEQFVKYLWRYE